MFDPTESHILWGGAVEVYCFGANTCNWSIRGKSYAEIVQNNPKVLDCINDLTLKYQCDVFIPRPYLFNAKIVTVNHFSNLAQIHRRIYRGADADAVFLNQPNQAYAVASADCPTVILFDNETGNVVAGHAGRDSLLEYDNHQLIHQMVKLLCRYNSGNRNSLRAIVVCGIGPNNFTHPEDDPYYGKANTALLNELVAQYGKSCVVRKSGNINLFEIIKTQLRQNGVNSLAISYDGTDTFSDVHYKTKEYVWHSNRREKSSERNLVLVVRR